MAKKKGIIYTCLTCAHDLEETEYPKSASMLNRQRGRLPYCKACCSEFYDRLLVELQDEMKALYKFCMQLDIYFDKDLANTLLANPTKMNTNLGLRYINKMGLVQYRNKTFADTKAFINVFPISEEELEEIMYINAERNKEEVKKKQKDMVTEEMIKRWGIGYEPDEYLFLEERYQTMLESYDDTNPASKWTYQEMCINYLELRKQRGNPTAQKNLNDIIDKQQSSCKMKISQLDNTEDDAASFGRFIDRIEMYEPCEKKLSFFDDIDGIRKYIKKWFVLPFARELEIANPDVVDELLEGEKIEDYSDVNKIYKEQKSVNIDEEDLDE